MGVHQFFHVFSDRTVGVHIFFYTLPGGRFCAV